MDHSVRYRYTKPHFSGLSQSFDGTTTAGFAPDFNLSLYRYVNNNPINLKDPSGLIGYGWLSSDRALKTKAQAYFILGIAEHVVFKRVVAVVIQVEAAKRAAAAGAIAAKNFARSNLPCAIAILAGYSKSEFGLDSSNAEDDALSRKLQLCYSAGQILNGIQTFFGSIGVGV